MLHRLDIRHHIDPITQVHTWGHTKPIPYGGPLETGLYYLPPLSNTNTKFSVIYTIISDDPKLMTDTAREVIKRQQLSFEFIKHEMKMRASEVRTEQERKALG